MCRTIIYHQSVTINSPSTFKFSGSAACLSYLLLLLSYSVVVVVIFCCCFQDFSLLRISDFFLLRCTLLSVFQDLHKRVKLFNWIVQITIKKKVSIVRFLFISRMVRRIAMVAFVYQPVVRFPMELIFLAL